MKIKYGERSSRTSAYHLLRSTPLNRNHLRERLSETETTRQNADDFIRDIKKYLDAPILTREMCYELIDRIIVGGLPKATGKERIIEIVYKVDIASVLRDRFKK